MGHYDVDCKECGATLFSAATGKWTEDACTCPDKKRGKPKGEPRYVGQEEKTYRKVDKPEPTPIFDSWKTCPECGCDDERVQLRVDYYEQSKRRGGGLFPVSAIVQQDITIHFHCEACGLTSEKRTTSVL